MSASTKSTTTTKPRTKRFGDSHKYVSTTWRTREDLLPHEISKGKLEENLLQKLKRNYEGRTIKDDRVEGFIRKGSLSLQERSRGFYQGAHFTGHITFDVLVHFSMYTPEVNTQVYATVRTATPVGFIAVAHPLRIMVVQNSTFQQENDLFEKIRPGLRIPIEILHFEPRGDHYYAVGRLMEYSKDYEKSYPIAIGELQIADPGQFRILRPGLQFVDSYEEVPNAQWKKAYGDPTDLNEAKKGLSDPDDPLKVLYYEKYIKQLLNDYEIVGNNPYFPNKRIFDLRPMPCSRAFFKLAEILKDFEIMEDLAESGEPLEGLLLAEAPGGFIHALMDGRAISTTETRDDYYRAVTAPVNKETGVRQDWSCNNPSAKKFLDEKVDAGLLELEHVDLTDPQSIRDLIAKYDTGSSGEAEEGEGEEGQEGEQAEGAQGSRLRKANIITADGGIDVAASDNYNFQEMMNYKLFYGEILSAIGCQAVGGTFVLKIYDTFTEVTNQLVQLLAQLWSEVQITKPKTSRPANSERYVVCMDFRGRGTFPLEQHLQSLQNWNDLEAETLADLRLTPTSPFMDRQFFVTSVLDIQLDPDVTSMLKEKNQIFVDRQIEAIQEGTTLLKRLRNPNIAMEEKRTIIRDRVNQQIRNAMNWCQEYLPKDTCAEEYPQEDLSYFTKDQNLRGDESRTVGGAKRLKALIEN